MTYSKYFPDESMMMIRDRFETMDESKTSMLYTLGLKDPTMALILSIVAGGLGIDRFYIGDTGLGIAKLLTCGGCGMTRSVKLCLEGELLAAVRLNPNIILVWIVLPIAPFILITQLATNKDYIARINACLDKKVYLFIILIAEGSIWIYNIVRHI